MKAQTGAVYQDMEPFSYIMLSITTSSSVFLSSYWCDCRVWCLSLSSLHLGLGFNNTEILYSSLTNTVFSVGTLKRMHDAEVGFRFVTSY